MRRNIAILMALILIISVVALSGCSPQITSGIVIDKSYEVGHTQTVERPIQVYGSDSGSKTIWVPTQEWVNERWHLIVRGASGDNMTTRTLDVSETIYNMVSIGDEVNITDGYITKINGKEPRG